MTWSYDVTDLDESTAAGRVNCVRLLVGDTNSSHEELQNEEITYFLSTGGDVVLTAARQAILAILAKYATETDIWIGHTREQRSQRVRGLKTLLSQLESDYTRMRTGMFVGGMYQSDKDALIADTDYVQPSFTKGMDDISTSSSSEDD